VSNTQHFEGRAGQMWHRIFLSEASDRAEPSRALADQTTARNSDLWAFLESMKQMEDRFNHWARYDYVFLNEEVGSGFPIVFPSRLRQADVSQDFSDEFKR
jgi:hypothetical protein